MKIRSAALIAVMIATACAVGTSTVVRGAGPDDLLKLRKGPGLDYDIIVGLPDGTRLTKQNCVTSNGKVWCRVTIADKPSVSGYVSAAYLALR